MQGGFPVRVFLNNLTEGDFIKILLEPENSLVKQYQALLISDSLNIILKNSGIKAIAKIAAFVNLEIENIGARRLFAIMDSLLEDESFNAPCKNKCIKNITIDSHYVNKKISHLIHPENIYNNIL